MGWATGLAHAIINTQNSQIQQMQGWLEAQASRAGTAEMCYEAEGDPTPGSLGTGALVGVIIGVLFGGLLIGLLMGKVAFGGSGGSKAAGGPPGTTEVAA